MQEPEFNINEITANFLSAKSDEIIKSAKLSFKKFGNTLDVKLKNKYTKYLKAIATKYGKTRTFFIRDNPKPLYEFYVPIGLKCQNIIIKSANIKDLIKINQRVLIQGKGGVGKTIILKHLLLDSLKNKHKIPVFLELRDIKDERENRIEKFIFDCLINFGLDIDIDYFQKSLVDGHYIFLLDGLDEVSSEIREEIIKEIELFSKKCSKCDFIITSRPDEKLSEFKSITTFETLPLNLEKSISLVSKLPAEEEIKEKFITDLGNGLFEKHETFLSNPLLLSIMLLTYGYSADIPNRLSIFYNQAYEALFQRHDALKGAYNRVRETELDIISFEKVICAFSLLTYDDNCITFAKLNALKYLERTKSLVGFDFNTEHFLKDLLQAVCLLSEDGLFLTYSHRSFQEYFVAKFISSSSIDIKKRLLKKYERNIRTDRVFKLTFELDQNFVEEEIIIPFLKKFFISINLTKRIGKTHFLKFLKTHWHSFIVEKRNKNITLSVTINNVIDFEMSGFIDSEIFNNSKNEYKFKHVTIPNKFWTSSNWIDYPTSSMKTTDEFFNFIYNSRAWFSKVRLERLKYCLDYLIEKHNRKSEDLESLLKAR